MAEQNISLSADDVEFEKPQALSLSPDDVEFEKPAKPQAAAPAPNVGTISPHTPSLLERIESGAHQAVDDLKQGHIPFTQASFPGTQTASHLADVVGPQPIGASDQQVKENQVEGMKTAAADLTGARGYGQMAGAAKKYAGTIKRDLSGEAYQHAEDTAGEREQAGTQFLGGAMEAATPLIPASVAAAPFRTAAAIGTGVLTGKGARLATEKLGGGEDAQNLAEATGQFVPSALGVAAGVKEFGGTQGDVRFGGASALDNRVGAVGAMSPEGAGLGVKVGDRNIQFSVGKNPIQDAADVLARRQLAESQVRAAAAGQGAAPSPVAPEAAPAGQPEVIPPAKKVHITDSDVKAVTDHIEGLPENERGDAIIEAQEKLSALLQSNGKTVMPNGRIVRVSTPEDADAAATEIINKATEQAEKQRDQQAKSAAENKPEPAPAQAEAQPDHSEPILAAVESTPHGEDEVEAIRRGSVGEDPEIEAVRAKFAEQREREAELERAAAERSTGQAAPIEAALHTPEANFTPEAETETAPEHGSITVAEPQPQTLTRYGNHDEVLSADKPHGLYMTLDRDGAPSAHEDVGPVKHTGEATPSNPLVTKPLTVEHKRFVEFKRGTASAGVSALHELSTPEEFEQFRKMSKPELVDYLSQHYPGPDYSKYHDSYELLEALGAQRARSAGHDAIVHRDANPVEGQPNFDEYVALHPNAVKLHQSEPAAEPKQLESPAPSEAAPEQPVSKIRAAELRASATPVKDIKRKPTGWLEVQHDNGSVLVHPYEDKVIPFEAKDTRSGTQAMRARMEAQAYAIDHPVEPKKTELPAGELKIRDIYGNKESAPSEAVATSQSEVPAKPAPIKKGSRVRTKDGKEAIVRQVVNLGGKGERAILEGDRKRTYPVRELTPLEEKAHAAVREAGLEPHSHQSFVMPDGEPTVSFEHPDLGHEINGKKYATTLTRPVHEVQSVADVHRILAEKFKAFGKELPADLAEKIKALTPEEAGALSAEPTSNVEETHAQSGAVRQAESGIASQDQGDSGKVGGGRDTSGSGVPERVESPARPKADELFRAGIAEQEQRLGKDTNNLDRMAGGLAKVLDASGLQPDPSYKGETYKNPFYWELAHYFHTQLTGWVKPSDSLTEIASTLAEHGMASKPQLVDENGHSFRNEFGMGRPAESMQAVLDNRRGYLGEELTKAEKFVKDNTRKLEIVKALGAPEESLAKAQDAIAKTQQSVDDILSRAKEAIAKRQQQDAAKEEAEKNRPVTNARELQPLDNLKTNIRRQWNGNDTNPKDTSWVTDGHSAIDTFQATKAGKKKVEQLQKPREGAPGNFIAESAIQSIVDSSTKKAQDAELLGYRTPSENLKEKTPLAYFADQKGTVVPVNAEKLKLIYDTISPDGVKLGGPEKAVVFYKNGDPAALLMPMRMSAEDAIDVPTARGAQKGEAVEAPKAAESKPEVAVRESKPKPAFSPEEQKSYDSLREMPRADLLKMARQAGITAHRLTDTDALAKLLVEKVVRPNLKAKAEREGAAESEGTGSGRSEAQPEVAKPSDTISSVSEEKGTGSKSSAAPEPVADEYRGSHRAPTRESGSPIYDLSETYPADIYSDRAAQFYGHYGSNNPLDRQTVRLIQKLKGQPDADIQIYRAVPKDIQGEAGINRGDWVTINRGYAKEHGETVLDGQYKILSKTVKARDIFTNGDSIHEWGYDPQGEVAKSDKSPRPSTGEKQQLSPKEAARQEFNQKLGSGLHSGIPIDALPAGLKYATHGVKEAAKPLSELISSKADKVREAKELHNGLADLDSMYSADVLRGVKFLQADGLGTAEDQEAIYHSLEDSSVQLTAKQERIRDLLIKPLMEEAERINEKLNPGGSVENYVHRIVKDSGSLIDRLIQNSRGKGGNKLSKYASATKGRTMMAAVTPDGERVVVSLKGGEAYANGKSLGTVKQDDLGRYVSGKDGSEYRLQQATTKEIESHTPLEYYKNAAVSAVTNFLEMRKAERAFDYVQEQKEEMLKSGQAVQLEGRQKAPEGYRTTKLPQMQGLYFERHIADVLDHYADKLTHSPNAWDKVGQFLRTSIFFNPLIHIPNIANHWVVEKGTAAYLAPSNYKTAWQAGVKAVNAVVHQNKDFLDALDAGAPLQSQQFETRQIGQVMLDAMSKTLENPEEASKISKALGYANPAKLVKEWYEFSGKATWLANDIFFLQATYEKMAKGMGLKDAMNETGKHIPDYRVPVHILGSKGVAKLMTNPSVSMFGAYHYGALKSYGEMVKEAAGGKGQTGKGLSHLLMLGMVTFLMYPLLDQLVKKATGDDKAEVRRAGASTFVNNAWKLHKGETSATDFATSVVTPAAHTKLGIELASNHDLRTGRQIYSPHADAKTIAKQVGHRIGDSVGPAGQVQRANEQGLKKTLLGMAGVSFPKHGAQRIASEIAASKFGTEAEDPDARDKRVLRLQIIDALRRGDSAPLSQARAKGQIDGQEAFSIRKAAHEDPLLHTVKSFTYDEIQKVYKAANEDERKKLAPLMMRKRAEARVKSRTAVEQ